MKPLLAILGVAVALLALAGAWALHPKGADQPHQDVWPQGKAAGSDSAALRITFLGTSLSAALPAATLEQQITACTGRPASVTVIAKGGAPSTWGATQIDTVIASAPDIVFVEFTINDADLRRATSLEDSAAAHRAILGALHTALPETKTMLLRLNRAYGLRAALRPHQARYDALLPDLAGRNQTGYLDLRKQWSAQGKSVLPDGIHPTAQAITEITLPALRETIARLTQVGPGCPKGN